MANSVARRKPARDTRSVDEIRATLTGRHCFTPVVHQKLGYIVGRADFGIPGYTPMLNRRFETYESARDFADEKNQDLGLSLLEAAILVADTMRGAGVARG